MSPRGLARHSSGPEEGWAWGCCGMMVVDVASGSDSSFEWPFTGADALICRPRGGVPRVIGASSRDPIGALTCTLSVLSASGRPVASRPPNWKDTDGHRVLGDARR